MFVLSFTEITPLGTEISCHVKWC